MRQFKYGNKKVKYKGVLFDSKKEMERYIWLKNQENKGEIFDLKLQPVFIVQDKFKFQNKSVRAVKYIADFQYKDIYGFTVIEDVKGYRTDIYKLKIKMFLNKYYENLNDNWVFREL